MKRTLDVLGATLLCVLLLPLLVAIALLVVVDSPGPVFYRDQRVGVRGRPLAMLKFRKLHAAAGGDPLTLAHDPLFTRVGAWLARTKLDELPQFWHVLRGQMSLVGPRPEAPEFVDAFREEYREITAVRPGLFGLSQLAFMREGSLLDSNDPIRHYTDRILPQKVVLDTRYALEWSPLLDLRVLAWSLVGLLLRLPVAVSRETLECGLRRR